MKIGIIDSDFLSNGGHFPNLALMKISGYYKTRGHEIVFIKNYIGIDPCDQYFLSKVFTFTHVPEHVFKLPNLTIGGTGFDTTSKLPYEIEHHMPDYHLYDSALYMVEKRYLKYFKDFSIGFTTRGCFRKCPFCVNKEYDRAILWSPLEEFVDSTRKYILLLDDNVLACKNWRSVIESLQQTGKRYQFKQGLDIRLISTDEKAEFLSNMKYVGDSLFAFDNIKDKEVIEHNLRLWKKYSPRKTRVYTLVGYYGQDLQDIIDAFERIRIITSTGCLPYIMKHELCKNNKDAFMYTYMSRWCNQPQFIMKQSMEEFIRTTSQECKKPSESKRYKQCMKFCEEHPEIYEKYIKVKMF